jgi:hypothetical protein
VADQRTPCVAGRRVECDRVRGTGKRALACATDLAGLTSDPNISRMPQRVGFPNNAG